MPVKKIITASAGTGKTYRLSLEFLGLVYLYNRYQEFKYDQVLVITFTRKATAEIRERIYKHLQMLGNREGDWQELAINLKEIVLKTEITDRENPLSNSEAAIFRTAWQHLSAHRDELQVMTIDSYVHSIFRNLVRPARGIDRFEIDNEAIRKRIPYLFAELMSPSFMDKVKGLLSRHMRPSLDEFNLFFINLVENRWLHFLTTASEESVLPGSLADFTNRRDIWQDKAEDYKTQFLQTFGCLIKSFCRHFEAAGTPVDRDSVIQDNLLKKGFTELFPAFPDNLNQLPEVLNNRLQDDYFARDLLKLMIKDDSFWNNQKFRAASVKDTVENWKHIYADAMTQLADYLVFRLFLPEQKEITDLWKAVLQQYDELVFRNKSFTYDDISWLTFEGLHSDYPPLFKAETDSQPNEFYEFISHRTRFILIDEFQDTSILQFRIFRPMIEELLSGIGVLPYGGIIVVGDEKQSIFGWRGGQRELLLNLEHLIQPDMPAEKAALASSWRSTPLLMKFINGVFRYPGLQNHLSRLGLAWQYQDDVEGMNTEQSADSFMRFRLQNLTGIGSGSNLVGMKEFVQNMIKPFWEMSDRPHGSIAILARTNNELDSIRYFLSEEGIPCEYQSSKTLLEHFVVKAVLYLLRFAVYHDWYDFLAFLRSDIVLMDGAPLRQVIDSISGWQKTLPEKRQEPDFSAVPIAQAAYELAQSIKPNSVWQSCIAVIQACRIQEKPVRQRDFVNIQKFLDAALEYEAACQSGLPELQGFLRFCEENRKQEIMQQQDVESTSAIQLLTVHKSKGLEFDTVFVWWKLRGHTGSEGLTLNSWVQYGDKGFSSFSNYAFTLHYKNILEHSSFKAIMDEDELRSQLEELNTLYVAMTRARSRLFLNAVFQNREGWENYFPAGQPREKLSLPHIVIDAVWQFMEEQAETLPDGSLLLAEKEIRIPAKQQKQSPEYEFISGIDLKNILPDLQPPALEQLQDYRPGLDWKKSFLSERDNLKGNIAHYFLAQIIYAARDEIERAETLTLRQFGNLMAVNELTALIAKIEQQLPTLAELFNPAYDLVLNEYAVYYKGREYRIDRLMLNTKAKTYRIIDYKTGGVYDAEQLNRYNKIIKEKLLPPDYSLEQELQIVDISLMG